jgi:DNA-binding winged helix-turn-helix (wHTH) protein/tetratricopeptide (TPR) repeat protein
MEESEPLHARFGSFVIDEAQARLERDGQAVEVAPRAFQVLCELVRRAGQLVTKDTLLDAVWGHRHINEAALKNLVSQLRQALGDDARESVFIQTVSRRGYRFIAPVDQPVAVHSRSVEAFAPAAVAAPTRLIGRSDAVNRLRAALAAARAGQRQLVFVVGEAGIGKSTLVERFVAESGVTAAHGQCIEHHGGAEPYMPVLEALNGLCREDGGGAFVELMRRVAPSWLLQMPWLARDEDRRELQREVAGATQERMLREFGELVDRATANRPLLLVIEDLHWSDHATVQLLDYLARRRGPGALMILGTLRATELILKDHPLAALRQELRLRRLCQDIDLEFLSEVELGELLVERLGEPVSEAFVRRLHEHTSGLPLFVVAVLDELIASGKLARSNGHWSLPDEELAVPRSIAAVIERQLGRLAPGQQRALGAASVGGIEFLHLTLAAVLQLEPDALHEQLEQAMAQLPWLRSKGTAALDDGRLAARYGFAHAIYRQVLYERLPALQRLQWHRQWAAALTATHAPSKRSELAAELALHFERGDSPVEAAAQLVLVAARALDCGAPHEALLAARQGLQLADGRLDPALELDLRVQEAVALTRLEVITAPAVTTAFERARALGPQDSPAWQRALQGCWWVHFARAEFPQTRALAEDMLDLAARREDATLRLAGLNAMGITQMLTGDFEGARGSLEEALAIYARVSAELPLTSFVQDPGVEAAEGLALVYWIVGQPARARQLAEHAVALAAANRHPLSEATALYAASIMHALAGEFETVHALTERLYAVILDHALPERRSGFAWLHGQALVALQRVDEGLGEMEDAARTARELGMRSGLVGFYYHHAVACRLAGREAEAGTSINAGLAMTDEVGETMLHSPLLLLRSESELAGGDVDRARASLQQAVEIARSQGAALFELQALDRARRQDWPMAGGERFHPLLALYEADPSPVIADIRSQEA